MARARSYKSRARSDEAITRFKKKRQVWSVLLFAAGILLFTFAVLGKVNAENPNGADVIHDVLCGMFGMSVFFVGPILIYVAVVISSDKSNRSLSLKVFQLIMMLLLVSAAIQIIFVGSLDFVNNKSGFVAILKKLYEQGRVMRGGGVSGFFLGYPLLLFGRIAASVIIILIVFVVVMLTANFSVPDFLLLISAPFRYFISFIKIKREQYLEDKKYLDVERERLLETEKEHNQEINRRKNFALIEAAASKSRTPEFPEQKPEQKKETNAFHDKVEAYIKSPEPVNSLINIKKNISEDGPYSPEIPEQVNNDNVVLTAIAEYKKETAEEEENFNQENPENPENSENPEDIQKLTEQYILPPTVLLNEINQEKSEIEIEYELSTNSVKLVETLKSFGVQTRIVGVCRGPSVTRYEIQPAPGVQISKITRLVDDIALSFASAGVRIEAPIPNKAAVGVEVPNRTTDTVPFRSLVESAAFSETNSKLGAAIGVGISGETIIADIEKMPHILIAGTTGSGKSVCVNSIIMSILFRSTPDEVRLLMIDPKAVEFMIYNGIPHLLIPVVTDPKKAAGALGWAVTEMLSRYKMFSDNNVRDINGYNSLAKGDPDIEPLPHIAVFIDELADLMMACPGEVEDSICRLAQMARAAGMHLVIATQRPSVNVVTGVIKANIPSRIALKVASQVDSRTIIDTAGAEKLLGKGDMLYFPVGIPKPMRVQGCWVSEKEVERVVDFIKNSFKLEYDDSVMEEIDRQAEIAIQNTKNKSKDKDKDKDKNIKDDKLNAAIEAVIDAGQASASFLQKKFKLGYGEAAKIIDTMEQMGIVSGFEGSRPRQVIITKQEWYERKFNQF